MRTYSGFLFLLGAAACGQCETSAVTAAAVEADSAGSKSLEQKPELALFVDQADLDGVVKRGVLRVLVPQPGTSFLPRGDSLQVHDEKLLVLLGERLQVDVDFIPVGEYDKLLTMLEGGYGDLVAAQLTVTKKRQERVAFSQSLIAVSEIVVGQRGAEGLPKSPGELAGREIHVRAGSSYFETLSAQKQNFPELKIVEVPENFDSESIAYQVSQGERPLSLLDSHILAAINKYNNEVEGLFTLEEGRKIAWAMRKDNPRLKSAVDAFLMERALSAHADDRFVGDVDEIKRRGVLRVITRNNPVTYYLHGGRQAGFDYTLARMFAKTMGVRLEMVVAPSRDQLIPWLLEGRGDIIAASLSLTADRAQDVSFSAPYLFVQEKVVQAANAANPLGKLADLKNSVIHVRKSSSYYQTLTALQESAGPFTIVEMDEDLETEELIDRVADGTISLTVADSHLLDVELGLRDDIVAALVLPLVHPAIDFETLSAAAKKDAANSVPIGFAMRQSNPDLLQRANAFVKQSYRGLEYNMARRHYFDNRSTGRRAKAERVGATSQLSPYDRFFRKYSEKYGLDWRLMAAQAYQESRFDPKAKSWMGALGLFQVMPATGRELGFTELTDPEKSTHAGVKYMHQLLRQFDGQIDFKNRIRFALASYNAGRGHVLDAQRIARQKGWDPNRWFHNVEKAMLLLQKPEYYKRARYGYCRGPEPVKYVSEIQSRYEDYIKIVQ